MKTDPLKIDPSRTAALRKAFGSELLRRWDTLRLALWKFLVTDRELDKPDILTNAPARKPFAFLTDDKKVKKFNRWLKKQVDAGILIINPTLDEPLGQSPWLYTWIDSAYRQGLLRAFLDSHPQEYGPATIPSAPVPVTPQIIVPGKPLPQPPAPPVSRRPGPLFMPGYDATRRQFLEQAFGQGERTGKLKLLYTRSYETLKGITRAMSSKMSRVLADGILNDKGIVVTARKLVAEVGLSKQRAMLLARTEIIHAHAEGQLDGFEQLGIKTVSATVELLTAGDSAVCPKCQKLEGAEYTIEEARGLIPLHPQCRCCWRPITKYSRRIKDIRKGKTAWPMM